MAERCISPSPFRRCAPPSLSHREREGARDAKRRGKGEGGESGFTLRWRSAEHGFTLIEIMVALAVFSLAALALVRLESATLRGAATIDDTLAATMLARTIAAEAATDARPPTLGGTSGSDTEGGKGWRWTRNVAPLPSDSRLIAIKVAVIDPRGTERGRASMIRSTIGAR